jgi:hypothetical protein
MENEGLTPEAVAAAYHVPLEAVQEAVEYVHANEEHLTTERSLTRQEAIAKGYLRSAWHAIWMMIWIRTCWFG